VDSVSSCTRWLKSADILAIREDHRRSRREAAHKLLDIGDELGMHN